jgi:NADPH:quinone reductase-like Zn-dependent oxidoreductase
MRAAVVLGHGGPEEVAIREVPDPRPGPGEVRVAVRAVALNHLDLWVRRGLPGLELRFPHVGGSDVAGTVDEVGPGVEGWRRGDRVVVNPALWCGECEWCRRGEESLCVSFRILGEHVPGGCAEYVVVPARNLLRIPDALSFTEAAAVPLVFQTAWRALIARARLQPGESVCVLGASGGVATAAIQIAKWRGARVFAVTKGPEKVEKVRALGADVVIDRGASDFSRAVWEATGKRGVDVVLDSVGAAVWAGAVRALARGGRLVTYGATTGPRAELDLRYVFWRQISILGSTMASRREFESVMHLVFAGTLRPVLDVVWPLDRARDAHERLERGEQFGKIVLTV